MADDTGTKPTARGPFRWLQRADEALFAVEQSIVSTALLLITVVIFVDVVARRAQAADSKVGQLVARLAGIHAFEERAWIDEHVAPWVTAALVLVLAGFGAFTGRRFARRRAELPPPPFVRELLTSLAMAVGVALLGWGLGYLFRELDSWMIYAAGFGLASLGYLVFVVVKRPPRWVPRAVGALVLGTLITWLATQYVPVGYTWSKKISLMLLLWVGMLSTSICVHAGKHIRVEAAAKLVPSGLAPYVHAAGSLAAATFCAALAYIAFLYIVSPEPSDDPYMLEIGVFGGTRYVFGFAGMIGRQGFLEGTEIPDWVGMLAAPIGLSIATARFVGSAVSHVLGGTYGATPLDESLEEARTLSESTSSEPTSASSEHTDSAAESESESESESGSESESESESGSESESEPESESESEPDTKPESEPDPADEDPSR